MSGYLDELVVGLQGDLSDALNPYVGRNLTPDVKGDLRRIVGAHIGNARTMADRAWLQNFCRAVGVSSVTDQSGKIVAFDITTETVEVLD